VSDSVLVFVRCLAVDFVLACTLLLQFTQQSVVEMLELVSGWESVCGVCSGARG